MRRLVRLIIAVSLLVASSPALAESDPDQNARKAEALDHFERGVASLEEKRWDAALSEFLASRALYKSRGNTRNAAVCLRNLGRYPEALDMFTELQREFALPPTDNAAVEQEINALRVLVATLVVSSSEVGTTVVLDGREVGVTPAVGRVRVATGSHTLRFSKAGFTTVEKQVQIAGGQTQPVEARLSRLAESGRLSVIERSSAKAEVVLDGATVGETPWEGDVSPGVHVITLRGVGAMGSQPISIRVPARDVTRATIELERLESHLIVNPTPANAVVTLDGVDVGQGAWEGKVRVGRHRVDVNAPRFLPWSREWPLARGESHRLQPVLERDASWTRDRWRFVVDAAVAGGISPSLGGTVLADGCSSPCSTSLPIAGASTLMAGVRFGAGFGAGVEGGALVITASARERDSTVMPVNLPPSTGRTQDDITAFAWLLGARAFWQSKGTWRWGASLGAGGAFGRATLTREGAFATGSGSPDPGVPFSVPSLTERASLAYLYVQPEGRISYSLGDRWQIFGSARVLTLFAIERPRTAGEWSVVAGPHGLARTSEETLLGSIVVLVMPGIGVRAEF